MLSKTLLFALFALATTTSAQADDDQSSNCVQGVFVVAARGSDPNWHDPTKTDPAYKDIDGLRDIGQSVINDVGKGSHLQALPYPASLDNYPVSVGNGIDAARKIIHNYVDNCSKKVDPKIVLLGYSQGAQVMSDTLVGGQGRGMLEDKYAKHIVAAALFADPSYVKGLSVDAGNSTKSGTLAKTDPKQIKDLESYHKILRDYCQAGDAFCASGDGPNNLTIHYAEVQTYSSEAKNFLRSVLK